MMMLTKQSPANGTTRPVSMVHQLSRGLAHALPTMDRRGFLRRSGVGVGVGLAATQLTLMKKSAAAAPAGTGNGLGKVEVKRTICTHCSVGCATDAKIGRAHV